MEGGSFATRAELLELKPVWIVATVLLGDVVAFLTVHAGHGDLGDERPRSCLPWSCSLISLN